MSKISFLLSTILEYEDYEYFTIKELMRKLNLGYNTIRTYLYRLVKQGYLEVFKDGRINYYRIKDFDALSKLRFKVLVRAVKLDIEKTREQFARVRKRFSWKLLEEDLKTGEAFTSNIWFTEHKNGD